MATYAKDTEVTVEKSRSEIERTLVRWGADQFAYGWQGSEAVIQFRARDRIIRFVVPLPDRLADEFWFTQARRNKRSSVQAEALWEKACRQRWRALALVVKAKLEAVESGIAEFEEEFLSYVVMPDGRTVGEHVRPSVAEAYESGRLPSALLALGGPSGGDA